MAEERRTLIRMVADISGYAPKMKEAADVTRKVEQANESAIQASQRYATAQAATAKAVARASRDQGDAEQKAADAAVKSARATEAEAKKAATSATKYAKEQQDAIEKTSRAYEESQQKQRDAMQKSGIVIAAVGAATLAGAGMAAKAAIEWESAWAGVTKTVNGSAKELAGVEDGLRSMAKQLPASTTEIAGVAEAAGQLGVSTGGIVSFTRTMIDLGQTTNLSAEEAASALARFMNVMGTSSDDVGRLGSTIVALGNNSATTEAEIVALATRLSGAAKTAGITESETLALSAALSSVGVTAELGGGTMTRAFNDMKSAVISGGDGLEDYAKIAGVTASEFAAAFNESPVEALGLLATGLRAANDAGLDTTEMLASIGAKGTEDISVFAKVAQASDLFNETQKIGNKGWEDNNALLKEAEQRYATTESRMAIAKNQISDTAITMGQAFLPAIGGATEMIGNFAAGIGGLPEPLQKAGGAFGLAAGGLTTIVGGAAIAIPRLHELKVTLDNMGGGASTLGKGLGAAGSFLAGPWGIAVAGAAIGLGVLVSKYGETKREAEALTSTLDQQTGAITEQTRSLIASKLFDDGTLDRAKQYGLNLSTVTDAYLGNAEALAIVREKIEGTAQSQGAAADKFLASAGAANQFTAGLDGNAASMFKAQSQYQAYAGTVDEDGKRILSTLGEGTRQTETATAATLLKAEASGVDAEASRGAAAASGELAVATDGSVTALGGVAPAAEAAYTSLAAYGESLGWTEEETKAAQQAIEAWGQSLAGFVDPLAGYTELLEQKNSSERKTAETTAAATDSSSDSWETYYKEQAVSVADWLVKLEEQVAAQANWSTNMTMLAGRTSQGTLDQLARMGPEGAPLVAQLVNASDDELRRMEAAFDTRTKTSTDNMATRLTLAQPVLTDIAGRLGRGVADEVAAKIAAGQITVEQAAKDYGGAIARGINPILSGLGRPTIEERGNYRGPGTTKYATGGPVWGAGTATSDSIPAMLSHGEFVINARATGENRELLEAINSGRGLPGQAVPAFAAGGLVALGREMQRAGVSVSRHSAFGGRPTSGHSKGSAHYTDNAIDANTAPGASAAEKRALRPWALKAMAAGFDVLFNVPGVKHWPGHDDHLHIGNPRGGSGSWVPGSGGGAPLVDLPKPPSLAPVGAPIALPGDASMKKMYDEATKFIAENTADFNEPDSPGGGNAGVGMGAGKGVEKWRPLALEALKHVGASPNLIDSMLRRMNQESGGNPRAINLWDSNAKKGIPSKGLLQTIDPTFQTHRDRSLKNDIYDPFSNMVASLRYAKAQYGNIARGYDRKGGYKDGGYVGALGSIDNPHVRDRGGPLKPGMTLNATGGEEMVIPIPPRVFEASAAGARSAVAAERTRPDVNQTFILKDTNPYVVAQQSTIELARRF